MFARLGLVSLLAGAVCACDIASGLDDFDVVPAGNGGDAGSGGAGGGLGGGGSAPSVCGDGVLAESEQCDDGNTDEGDRCTADCEVRCPGTAWTVGPDFHCYIIGSDQSDRDGARIACEQREPGAYLAVLSTVEELDIADMIVPPAAAWIGGNDAVEGEWAWDNGEPWEWPLFEDPPWLNDLEPNDSTGDEDCLEVLENGRFNDVPCDISNHPLCELDPAGS